jgi:hypothetical protein
MGERAAVLTEGGAAHYSRSKGLTDRAPVIISKASPKRRQENKESPKGAGDYRKAQVKRATTEWSRQVPRGAVSRQSLAVPLPAREGCPAQRGGVGPWPSERGGQRVR